MIPIKRQFLTSNTLIVLLVTLGAMPVSHAQVRLLSPDEAVQLALQNNPGLRSISLDVNAQEQLKRTALEVPKTQAMLMYGQYNSINKDNNFTITQSLPFPTVFTSQSKLGELRIQSSQHKRTAAENELTYQVKQVYHTLQYLHARQDLLRSQDSIFSDIVRITSVQHAAGEAALLLKTSAETRYNEVQNLIRQNEADRLTMAEQLRILLNVQEAVTTVAGPFRPLTTELINDSVQVSGNPQLAFQRSLSSIALQEKKVEGNKALPDLTFGYFNQTLIGFQQQTDGTNRYFSSNDRFSGFMVGVSLPIWFVPARAHVKAASIRSSATALNTEYFEKQLYGEWHKAVQQFEKYKNSLDYYVRSAMPNAALILRQSRLAYHAGDISQSDYRLNINQALSIEEAYIQTVLQYNQAIITLEYLAGKNPKN